MRSLQLIAVFVWMMCSFAIAQSNEILAHKKFELGDYESAITAYQGVLAEDPENTEAMIKLAESYRMSSRLEQAKEWYSKVADVNRPAKAFIFNYAKTLQELGQYKEAKNWFLKYAEIDPVKGRHFALSCDYALHYDMRSEGNLSISELSVEQSTQFDLFALNAGDLYFRSNTLTAPDNADLHWYKTPVSTWSEGGTPQLLTNPLQDDTKVVSLAFNNNVNKVALTEYIGSQLPKPIVPAESLRISIAEKSKNGHWNDVKTFPFNVNGYSSGYCYWSSDDNALYFSSNRPGGFGGYDIYISYYEGGQWTFPQNLGPNVNSSGNEIVSSFQNGTIYFSSDYHNGFGGFDMFKSEMMGFEFGSPVNMGMPMNSSADDLGIVLDNTGTYGFFQSDRENRGHSKIFHVQYRHESADVIAKVIPQENVKPIELVALPQTKIASVQSEVSTEEGLAQFTSSLISNATSTVTARSTSKVESDEDNIESNMLIKSEYEVVEATPDDQQNVQFFIQVAAITKFTDDLSRFNGLAKFGNVYSIQVNGVTKIRVGPFDSMGKAVDCLKRIKADGYSDAYMIQEPFDSSKLKLIAKGSFGNTSVKDKINRTSAEDADVPTTTSQATTTIPKEYKVRLTAYHYNTQFDTKSVAYLGEIEQWTKGSWRIILLGGYPSLEAARTALNKAKARGFEDAYLVVEEDGLLLPYEE